MEIITSILRWIFIDTIYGIAIITVVVFSITYGIKKIVPKFPSPEIIACLVFFIALFTIPSIPRYEFEKQSLSQIEGKEWIRIINKTQWGSVLEPVTWFYAPIGSIFLVMPNSPLEGGYREVLMRYEEEPKITLTDPDCTDSTIVYSEADSEGVFRITSTNAEQMSEQEVSIYCEYNWKKEKEALRVEMIKKR